MDGAFAGPRVAMCLRRMGVDSGHAGTVGEVRNSTQYVHPGHISFEELKCTVNTLGDVLRTSARVVAKSSTMQNIHEYMNT